LRRADWLRVLDLRRADDHLQSGFWQRTVAFCTSRRGGFSDGHLHRFGGSSGSSLSLRCHIFYGHHSRDITPLGFSTCHQSTSVLVIPGGYNYSSGLLAPERVLTSNDAGIRQRSLSGRRLGLCLRGRSGLLSGRRGFLFRHHCGGFIPLPGQVRRFPAEYTSWLSIKYDYHIQHTTQEESTLTSLIGPPSRLGCRGYWQCRPVLPRQVPLLAPQ
jgi:hypothetical protein